MPMPHAYRTASKDWQAFLADAKDRMGLASDNMTYTAVDGVLQTFRRRLSVEQALAFADILPAVLRALFVYRWRPGPCEPWADRASLAAEAQAVRKDHNLTPDSCIEDTAWALRRAVRQIDLDRVLAGIGPEAQAFWAVDVQDPHELERRFP